MTRIQDNDEDDVITMVIAVVKTNDDAPPSGVGAGAAECERALFLNEPTRASARGARIVVVVVGGGGGGFPRRFC